MNQPHKKILLSTHVIPRSHHPRCVFVSCDVCVWHQQKPRCPESSCRCHNSYWVEVSVQPVNSASMSHLSGLSVTDLTAWVEATTLMVGPCSTRVKDFTQAGLQPPLILNNVLLFNIMERGFIGLYPWKHEYHEFYFFFFYLLGSYTWSAIIFIIYNFII